MTDKKLVTLYHPTLPDVTQEVYASDADGWTEQGWRKTAPKIPASE